MKTRRGHGVRTTSAAESEIRSVLKLLSDTPTHIARNVCGCSDQQLDRRPEADAWSQEVVAHLRACAEVLGRQH